MKADIMVQKWGLGWGLRTHILMLKLRTTLFWAPTLPGPILQTLAVLKQVAELWASHLFSWPFWKDGLWISALGGERINSLPHSSCPSGGVCWLEQLRTDMWLSNQASALSARKWEEREVGEGWIITRGGWLGCGAPAHPRTLVCPLWASQEGSGPWACRQQSPGGADHLECSLQLPQPGLEKAPEGEASLPPPLLCQWQWVT